MGINLNEITINEGQTVKLKTKPNNPLLINRMRKINDSNKPTITASMVSVKLDNDNDGAREKKDSESSADILIREISKLDNTKQ